MSGRRRIRDISHRGCRWIVALAVDEDEGGVWRGTLVFVRDEPAPPREIFDDLIFEALAPEALMSQAAALGVDELQLRLERRTALEEVHGP